MTEPRRPAAKTGRAPRTPSAEPPEAPADTAEDGFDEPAEGDDGHLGGAAGWADDERVQAGIEHLQRAANEAIAAGRALLDVAEDLVGDPRSLTEVLGLLGRLRPAGGPAPGRRADDPDRPDDDPPVQRIPVS